LGVGDWLGRLAQRPPSVPRAAKAIRFPSRSVTEISTRELGKIEATRTLHQFGFNGSEHTSAGSPSSVTVRTISSVPSEFLRIVIVSGNRGGSEFASS